MAGCCSDEQKPEAVSKDVCCDPSGAFKCSATATTTVNAMVRSRLSSFRIEQMDCPTEQTLIQDKLSKLAGIDKLDFNLINRVLGVWHSLPSTALIEAAISSLGMQAEPLSAEGQARITIEQMDCPTEEKLIRDKLSSLTGISALEFNLLQRVLTFSHTAEALPAALAAIRDLGFTPVVEGAATVNDEAQAAPRKKAWWPLALSGVAAVSAEVLHFAELAPEWVVAGVALLAILLCGLTTYKKGWIALKNRNLNINALMSIAVTGAVLIGQWPEAAMVMFLFSVAELIEAKSLGRARNAIRGLMDLTPERATVQQADGSWLEGEVKTIALGALVRARPGERIGLDGEVTSGNSTINQAPITGESLPVEKTVGDPVFAGTINQAGSLEYRVVAAAANTTLARIIHAVEEAQGSRAPTQRFVDQFAK